MHMFILRRFLLWFRFWWLPFLHSSLLFLFSTIPIFYTFTLWSFSE